MVVIAILAPLFGLVRLFDPNRYSVPFGFFVAIGLIALFVGYCARRGRYGWIASLIIGYPLVPLLILHLTWGVIKLRFARRSSVGFLDGMFGISDIGAMVCLAAYVGCVSVWLGAGKSWSVPELRSAAKRVVLLMPPAWVGLFVFAIWDPFGALEYLFHF
jgi:hypothetical protein